MEILTAAKVVFFSVFWGGLLAIFVPVLYAVLLKPRRLRSRLQRQGIRGPPPSFWYGNIPEMQSIIIEAKKPAPAAVADHPDTLVHSCPQTLFPHLVQWRNEYGPVFLYSTGNIQMLSITDPEMAKEVSLCTSLDLGKPTYLSTERGPLLGRGILSSNGPYWAHQRRIIAPEFYSDKVKDMVNLIVESTLTMLESWEGKIRVSQEKVELTVDEDMRRLSADIISRACFGRSYKEGEQIFDKLQSLQKIMSGRNIGIPGLRYLPNKHNKEVRRLETEIDSMILEVVKARGCDDNRKDLLRLLLDAAEVSAGDDSNATGGVAPNKFIVDNCKNIYFAGHETTAISASWCLMALAAHPEWQERARDEIVEICRGNVPTADMLRKMKVLTMVIQETLRLYPPVAYVVREALQDISFKGIDIPRGTNIQVPIPIMHQMEDLWGVDANEFKPERFANGVSGACRIPQGYMPFGVGHRTCVGQHFAMAELKAILSLVLSKFRLSLSPGYRHCPFFGLLIQPKYGVCVVIEKLD